jgi:hypothetical protein
MRSNVRAQRLTCKTQSHGADDGIDIHLYFAKEALAPDLKKLNVPSSEEKGI